MSNEKHSHYFREWHGKIDIYRLCDLFNIKRKAIDHAVKKLVCGGGRGAKDEIKDYEEAIDSIKRAIEMIREDQAAEKGEIDEAQEAQIDERGSLSMIPRFTEDEHRAHRERLEKERLMLNAYVERMNNIARNGNDGLHYEEIKPYQDSFEE